MSKFRKSNVSGQQFLMCLWPKRLSVFFAHSPQIMESNSRKMLTIVEINAKSYYSAYWRGGKLTAVL